MTILRNLRSRLISRTERVVFALFAVLWTATLAACDDVVAKYGPPSPDQETIDPPVRDSLDTIVVKYGSPTPVDSVMAKYGSPSPVRDSIAVRYGVFTP